jgi:elongation factor Ts
MEVMMEIAAALVKELRERSGAGIMDCKKALLESGGDVEKAGEYLRVKGLIKAQQKSERTTAEGLVVSYIHPGNRIGVLLEVNCETDFAAKTDEFQVFSKNIAMQIAATAPLVVNREELSAEVIEKEKELCRRQALEEKKPENVIDKIVEGRMEKFYAEACLVDQVYIRDSDVKINDLTTELIAKIGENVKISRFARFQLGG